MNRIDSFTIGLVKTKNKNDNTRLGDFGSLLLRKNVGFY